MKNTLRHILICFLLSILTPTIANAQRDSIPELRFMGVIVDEETGDSIQLASMKYAKLGETYMSDMLGRFDIPKREKNQIIISAIGYKSQRITIDDSTPTHLRIELKPDSRHLKQVEVRAKKRKYSRKENPAVELMRRVVAANKANNLKKTHEFYRYNNYQKLTLAINDVNPSELTKEKNVEKRQWYLNQLTICPENGKLILPVNMEESVTEELYSRETDTERSVLLGQKTEGVNKLLETGHVVNRLLDDIFTDIDLYQNQVRLLQYPFTSPIGSSAVNFYRYYLVDTLMIGDDRCIHLEFLPNNQQDFGFRGDLYVLDDSTLHVRRCDLTIPKKSDVNWVQNIKINLEYEKLPTSEWVLTRDDMFCELSLTDFLTKTAVFRTTRRTDYSFEAIPSSMFEGFGKERKHPDYNKRDEAFWTRYRTAYLTDGELHMADFVKGMRKSKGFGFLLTAFKLATENFIELGNEQHPSKVDIGPLNTLLSYNFIDGLRTRVGLSTTAHFSKHIFVKGYAARGWKSEKNYYNVDLAYSFNAKERTLNEYPKRKITFTSAYDNMSPSNRFGVHDKDNIFTMLKWTKDENKIFYNLKQIAFDWEQYGGMEYMLHYRWEKQKGVGNIEFPNMNLSEVKFGIRYAPGENTVETKRRRVKINQDNPIYELSHTVGFDGFLGGTHRYNTTVASIYNRFWLNSWGKLTVLLKGSAQWNKVPYMLLLQAPANTSYIMQRNTFSLMNEMEFLTDRNAMLDAGWDLNGKILNRIPLLKKLKWREFIGFKCFWGTVTEKNKPTSLSTTTSEVTESSWPVGVRMLDSKKPYMEFSAGFHNVFKFFDIQYVRRLNYTEFDNIQKQGIRVKFEMTF
ncbi:MAG: DUF5686 family protein [Bacteroidaceae bacterium]|nr:DUF5686 family protein [Bacteroidaceae bacterium]